MQYDVRLELKYAYQPPAAAGRHLVRVMPMTVAGEQRVVAASIAFDPGPVERTDGRDFFGNAVASVAYREPHATLSVRMSARVAVDPVGSTLDLSPDLATLRRELNGVRSLAPDSPHHFATASPRVALDDALTAYAGESLADAATVGELVGSLGRRIHGDFRFDKASTDVDTPPKRAFEMRRGVCQDFTHVMIAGLRGVGIPAAYVSGFLRTIPPKGKPRLEGADAMHAWVRVWCGQHAGWIEFDPTNAMLAGADHITIGHGRDYADISPIVGVLRTSGNHETTQSVDVIRVE